MPAQRKLKVFRTSIGFHDAYVAAPSRKAALAAWGAATELFAIGSAEQVIDTKLMQVALDHPGEIVRQSRGSAAQHMEAAELIRGPKGRRSGKGDTLPKISKPRPQRSLRRRPDSGKLDEAEAALDAFECSADTERRALREREQALAKEKSRLEQRLTRTRDRLEQQVEKARSQHERALARWRAAI
ncbi:hypothetical protein [Novosphingobium sp. JCM 18896]|uniref:hypothetical protein n=1 Tax=Novosphingobium sp. JCM 18896 TaxID=2989731 RepID=UPI0022212D86|nr:hypothetical protein [Novosphingobium sp. JCM 18896]MCW1430277.1 hypothetical protein [Novosphingobium sp. JCM 18896]